MNQKMKFFSPKRQLLEFSSFISYFKCWKIVNNDALLLRGWFYSIFSPDEKNVGFFCEKTSDQDFHVHFLCQVRKYEQKVEKCLQEEGEFGIFDAIYDNLPEKCWNIWFFFENFPDISFFKVKFNVFEKFEINSAIFWQ